MPDNALTSFERGPEQGFVVMASYIDTICDERDHSIQISARGSGNQARLAGSRCVCKNAVELIVIALEFSPEDEFRHVLLPYRYSRATIRQPYVSSFRRTDNPERQRRACAYAQGVFANARRCNGRGRSLRRRLRGRAAKNPRRSPPQPAVRATRAISS